MIFRIFPILLIVVFFVFGCTDAGKIERTLVSYQGNDTVSITLIQYRDKKDFYGTYHVAGPGNYVVTGSVQGEIKADTLIGTIYYTPFGWRDKKRRAFAMLASGNTYYQGDGIEMVYMGIPHFVPESLSFDRAKRVFHVVE